MINMHEKNKRVIGCNSRHLFMMVKKTCSRRNILKKLRTRSDFAKIVNDTISTDFNRYDMSFLSKKKHDFLLQKLNFLRI